MKTMNLNMRNLNTRVVINTVCIRTTGSDYVNIRFM